MPIPWLTAIKAVPWSLLLKNAPQIVKAADSLAAKLRTKQPSLDAADDLQSLAQRIAALEEHDQSDAQVIKQMAEQIQALTTNSAFLAARLRLITYLSAGTAILATVLGLILWLNP